MHSSFLLSVTDVRSGTYPQNVTWKPFQTAVLYQDALALHTCTLLIKTVNLYQQIVRKHSFSFEFCLFTLSANWIVPLLFPLLTQPLDNFRQLSETFQESRNFMLSVIKESIWCFNKEKTIKRKQSWQFLVFLFIIFRFLTEYTTHVPSEDCMIVKWKY